MVPSHATPAVPVFAMAVCALMERGSLGSFMGPRTEGLPPEPTVLPTLGTMTSARAKMLAVEGPHMLLLSTGRTGGSAVWWRSKSVALEELSEAVWGEICGEVMLSPS